MTLDAELDAAHPHYQLVSDLGKGSFGVTKLMRHLPTGELMAVKLIERGAKINEYVQRELSNHRRLLHPHIVQFREIFLTRTHLAIVMEYAAGGELFAFLAERRYLTENEARNFFQQLICGLDYCHAMGVCHRDLKLENTLLDGRAAPRLKICDFGYSKHSAYDSQPKSIVGTRAYIAPEIILCRFNKAQYNGEAADVWSAGVMLYLMLTGTYPFEDRADPNNFSKVVQRICLVQYEIPAALKLSPECVDLIQRLLVGNPGQRIGIPGILAHPWFRRHLPIDLQDGCSVARRQMHESPQAPEEIKAIMAEACRVPPPLHQLSNTLLPLPPLRHVSWEGKPAAAPQLPPTHAPSLQQMRSQRTGPLPLHGDYAIGGADSVEPSGPRLECVWKGQQNMQSEDSLFSEMWRDM